MSSVQFDCRTIAHTGALERCQERCIGGICGPASVTTPHGTDPSITVVSSPIVEQEIGGVFHRGDEHESWLVGGIDHNGHPEPFRIHQ